MSEAKTAVPHNIMLASRGLVWPFWKNMSEMCFIQLEIWNCFIHSQVGPSAVWRILAQQQLAAKQITSLRKSAAGSSSHIYKSSIDHVRISEPSFDILWSNQLCSTAPGKSTFKIIDRADQTQCHDFKHRSDLRHRKMMQGNGGKEGNRLAAGANTTLFDAWMLVIRYQLGM